MSVCGPSFHILRDCPLVFSNFCVELGHHKGIKVSEPDIEKKSLGSDMGENPYFGGILIFEVFCPYPYIQLLKFLKFHILDKLIII